MAVKYVDPILGSDTTGDGSAATPWQTQSHAMAAMAASDTLQIVGPGRLEDMLHRVMDYSNNRLHTDAQLVAEDVEIGAVEIKNATDDTRATVGANGLHVDVQAAGTPITDQALEAGGAGVLGWLASIRKMVEALKTTIVLAAGSAIIGKVGIDQTTDGTTNAVNVKTTSGAGATIGATDGAAVITDANGTLQQYLRGLVKLIVSIISVKIDQTTPGTTNGVVVNAGGAVASLTKISPIGGSKTVTTSGTGVPLVASATPAKELYVRPKATNTGNVYLGDSSVDVSTSKQIVLSALASPVTITADSGYRLDVGEWYIDADVNGEGVDFLYVA